MTKTKINNKEELIAFVEKHLLERYVEDVARFSKDRFEEPKQYPCEINVIYDFPFDGVVDMDIRYKYSSNKTILLNGGNGEIIVALATEDGQYISHIATIHQDYRTKDYRMAMAETIQKIVEAGME